MDERTAEKIKFIREQTHQIAPSVEGDASASQTLDSIKSSENVSPETVEHLLERFETKFFVVEKTATDHDPDAKRVLVAASDPLQFNTTKALVAQLSTDLRCRQIGLLTDRVAGREFERLAQGKEEPFHGLTQVGRDTTGAPTPLLYDALKTAENEPYDVAIVSIEAPDAASDALFFSAKSAFGAKRFILLLDSWTAGSRRDLWARAKHMNKIDAVCVNDELARKIYERQLPKKLREKIIVTGSPVIDALDLEHEAAYEQSGREKLGLSSEEVVLLYSGDVSADYRDAETYGAIDPEINEKTFVNTIMAMVQLAKAEPEKKFALLVRPHPRDPNKKQLLSLATRELPKNLRVVFATKDIVSMNETAYASDFVASIMSTENFLAPSRGRAALFLGFGESGLGQDIHEKVFGKELMRAIQESSGTYVVASSQDIVAALRGYNRKTIRDTILSQGGGNSIDRIIAVAFSKKE